MVCRYCGYCGANVPPGTNYCPYCGRFLQQAEHVPAVTAGTTGRRFRWITAGIVSAVLLAVAAVLIVTLVLPDRSNPKPETTAAVDSTNPFKAEIMAGFDFEDVATADQIVGEPRPALAVRGLSPSSGTVGTGIQISGVNLDGPGPAVAMLGDTEMVMRSVTEDLIEATIPAGARSGDVRLSVAGQTIDAGYLEVIPQETHLLLETDLVAGAEPQTVTAGAISVTVPGGAISGNETVRIEQIIDPQPVNLPASVTGVAFSIEIGDMHEFGDLLTIGYTLPADTPGEPSVAYFNEETSLWDTLPGGVMDGTFYLYTDHLTDFFIFYWGKAVYSPDEHFKIYYEPHDTFNYGVSMDDLARKVGVTLEKVREDYEATIPAGYREDFSYLGMFDAMDVYLDSGHSQGSYNALTNNLLLPTTYSGQDDFETVLAHEFFHAYQDSVWNEIKMVGKMSRSDNMWAVEALAELAAYESAFPEKKREREITGGVLSQDPYNTFDEIHEYSMSCFLRYLLRKTGSTFEELWMHTADSDSYLISTSFNEFFKSKSSGFISLEMAYTDFWLDVIGDVDAPRQVVLDLHFDGRTKSFAPDEHAATFQYQSGSPATMAFNLFKVSGYSANVPLRIFCVACPEGSRNGAWSTDLAGVRSVGDLNGARVPGGHAWDRTYAGGPRSDSHELHEFTQGVDQVVVIALDGEISDSPAGVRVSEIQAQCRPAKLENAIAGKEYEFSFAFKDIFPHVGQTVVVVDFGDGKTIESRQTNETGALSGAVCHTYTEPPVTPVKCSLYDASGSDRQLISQLVIPVDAAAPLTLSASPNPVETGVAVQFTAGSDGGGYAYEWDFGDGATLQAQTPTTEHTYDQPGTYDVSLKAYDDEGGLRGTARQTITVTAPASTTTIAEASPLVGTWQAVGEPSHNIKTNEYYYFVSTLILSPDETCSWEVKPVLLEVPDDSSDVHYPLTMYPSLDHEYYIGTYEVGDAAFADGTIWLEEGGQSLPSTFGVGENGEELYFQSTILKRQ